jgi:hypothetical protein
MDKFPIGSSVRVIGFVVPQMSVYSNNSGFCTAHYLDDSGEWQKATFDERQLELVPEEEEDDEDEDEEDPVYVLRA